MMKKISNLFHLLVLLHFVGCVTTSTVIRTDMHAEKKEGMIAGTVSILIKSRLGNPDSYTLEYSADTSVTRLINGDKPTWTKGRDMNGRYSKYISGQSDYLEAKNHIFLFNIVRPQGKYVFFKLSLFFNSVAMYSTSDYWLNIPFEIKEGQTIYLGEIEIDHKNESITVNDKIDRDRKYFNEMFPTIKF